MIFQYTDYRKFLYEHIKTSSRGVKIAISSHISCKPSYLSQVLKGTANFNNEQTLDLSVFLKLTETETEYLLLLVQYERAGTKLLKKYFLDKIKAKQLDSLHFKNRLTTISKLTSQDEFKYFSKLEYSLVNLLLTIPHYQLKQNILNDFNFSPEQLEDILQFLLKINLIKYEKNKYFIGEVRIHLPHDSVMISTLHTNWRVHTIKNLPNNNSESLHYSAGITISKEDKMKLKSMIVRFLEECKQVVRDSGSETICGFCIDFYEIKK